ncbi:MAG TPA: alpha/beta fold hydrolase [Pyrinomonadaceae bacterium]|nr:alpha/beta fold hydrolase [Pyrinomonadaceae bacterium]
MTKVHIRGIDIAYDDEGTGAAIILLHGYPFNRSMWREQVSALRPSHRIITPDLRGHGETDAVPATIPEMARDAAALLTTLGITDAVVGGLSMGGYVALSFCRLFPERVSALVLADTRASADTAEGKQNRAKQAERALSEGLEGIADEMLPKLLSPETLATRPEIAEQLRKMIIQTKPEGASAALKAMATRDDQTVFLSQITKPTLIVVGRDDAITPLTDSELMHREIEGSHLEVIEGAGHVSNLEQPDNFNKALENFLGLQS